MQNNNKEIVEQLCQTMIYINEGLVNLDFYFYGPSENTIKFITMFYIVY
jgi:hypothetical protein